MTVRNGSATISISVMGYPAVLPSDITWSFDSNGVSSFVSNSEHYLFSDDRTELTILNTQVSHGGIYSITAHNIAGQSNVLEIAVDVYGKKIIIKS